MKVQYKGYELVAASTLQSESEKWTVTVTIFKICSETKSARYEALTVCDTQKEANEKSIEFGKQIIDGKCQGLSVSELG
jgi:hypothetical protein